MIINNLISHINRLDSSKIESLNKYISAHKNIIILGNGGSSSIASHIAQDYTKVLKKRCLTFSDSSRLTCYINDYGQEYAYSKFLEEFSYPTTLVILISSSGNSKNIINCAELCVTKQIPYILLTGFDMNNLLRSNFSDNACLEFWIDSDCYGTVETLHQIILHSVC